MAIGRVRRGFLSSVAAACLLAITWLVPAAMAASSSQSAEAFAGDSEGSPATVPAQSNDEATHAPSKTRRTALFFALFDCSWQNAKRGPTEPTTVATLHQRLSSVAGFNLHVEYVKTDCARENWFSSPDAGKAVSTGNWKRCMRSWSRAPYFGDWHTPIRRSA
jgi:hypothetical protein